MRAAVGGRRRAGEVAVNTGFNERCPCKNEACPCRGRCVECVKRHWNTPPGDVVACQREKARRVYAGKQKDND